MRENEFDKLNHLNFDLCNINNPLTAGDYFVFLGSSILVKTSMSVKRRNSLAVVIRV